jgi:hypothetical protein
LGLDLSIGELKTLAGQLPARLIENGPYGYLREKCNALNTRFGACLTLKTK